MLAETGILLPGHMIDYVDGATTRRGIVRSSQVNVQGSANIWQSVGLETHDVFKNPYARLVGILPKRPLMVGTVTGVDNGVAVIELPGGGTDKARGDATVGQHVFSVMVPSRDLPCVGRCELRGLACSPPCFHSLVGQPFA